MAGLHFFFVGFAFALYELWSKLLKGGYIGDYIGKYSSGY